MKRFVIWFFIIVILASVGLVTWHFLSPYKQIELFSAVPDKPVFIIEIDNSYKTWETLTKSKVWGQLKKHQLFAQAAEGIDMLDTLIQSNGKLAQYIGSRSLVVSMHIVQHGTTDFVYALDLRRASKLLTIKNFLNGVLDSKFNVKNYEYNTLTVYKIDDTKTQQTLHLYFKHNLMVASYSQKLIEKSIDQIDHPKLTEDKNFLDIRDLIKGEGLLRFYVNYTQLDNYTNGMLTIPDSDIRQVSKSLFYTGLALNIENDNLIRCEGFTNFNDSIISSIRAMSKSGSGRTGLAEVLPIQTASSVSLGFDRFTEYFDNLMDNMKEVKKSYNEYQANIKQAENFLKIDVRKNIMSWIGDEAAMVHLPPMGLGKNNEFAVFLKTRDLDDAKKNLDFVMNQVRKRSPATFEQVEYNGYFINYLSMKGFFRMLLGKYFQKLEKPYFTYIGDYVVFSNHPQTLKVIIDGFARKQLLNNLPDYKAFVNTFTRSSNFLMLINTSQFLQSLQGSVNASTWSELQKNKEYIVSFPYMGFQLDKDGSLFKTRFNVAFTGKALPIPETIIPDSASITNTDTVKVTKASDVKADITKMLIQAEDYIPDDIKAPEYKENYDNGQLKVIFVLRDGFRHGDYKEYYENGSIKIKGQYRHDHKDGVWKIYSADGKLVQKVKFNDGKIKE